MMWASMEMHVAGLLGLLLMLISLHPSLVGAYDPNVAKQINDRLSKDKYDKRERPGQETGEPVKIYFNIQLRALSEISEAHMEYTMDVEFHMYWDDNRLSDVKLDNPYVITNRGHELWQPDVFISNLKFGSLKNITQKNWAVSLLPKGMILHSERLTLTLGCDMDLHFFPWDSQICDIVIQSYGYTSDHEKFEWVDWMSPVSVLTEEVNLPEFKFIGWVNGGCEYKYDTGEYSCLRLQLAFKRQTGYYMIQTYIPSMLTVIVSWVSFWINKEAAPARVSLGLLTVLTTVSQISSLTLMMPKVSYVKVIDIWNAACLVFVFGAAMEYVIVNYVWRTGKREDTNNTKGSSETKGQETSKVKDEKPVNRGGIFQLRTGQSTEPLDKFCRLAFPLAFSVFNIAYWGYTLSIKEDYTEFIEH